MNCCSRCIPGSTAIRLVRLVRIRGKCDYCERHSQYLINLNSPSDETNFWLRISHLCDNITWALNAYDPQGDENLVGVDMFRYALVDEAAVNMSVNREFSGDVCIYEPPSRERVFEEWMPAIGAELEPSIRKTLIGDIFEAARKWSLRNEYCADEYEESCSIDLPPLCDWEDIELGCGGTVAGKPNCLHWAREQLELLAVEFPAGRRLYRSRVGFRLDFRSKGLDLWEGWPVAPIPRNLMGAPPPMLARAGRVSPARKPVLYLSTDASTAIAEQRPWRGALVSVAEFRLRCNQRLLDLADTTKRLSPLSGSLWNVIALRNLLGDIRARFSLPVDPAPPTVNKLARRKWLSAEGYEASQMVSRVIKKLSYDGIVYTSAMANGRNIALFEKTAAIPKRSYLFEVESVSYTHSRTRQSHIATGQMPLEGFSQVTRCRSSFGQKPRFFSGRPRRK